MYIVVAGVFALTVNRAGSTVPLLQSVKRGACRFLELPIVRQGRGMYRFSCRTSIGIRLDSLEGVKMLPTHRQSHGRSRRRRSHHALTPADSTICPLSGMPKRHHRVSSQSGYVRPGLVIRVKKLGIGVSKD